MSNNERVNKVDIHKGFLWWKKKIILVFQILYKIQFHEKKLMETEVLGGKPSSYFYTQPVETVVQTGKIICSDIKWTPCQDSP